MSGEGMGTIQELYVFTPTNLLLLPPLNGYVIIARRQPVKGSGVEGRYIVYRNPNEDSILGIRSEWLLEEHFQTMLKQSGITLPEPDPAEIRAAKDAVRQATVEDERVRQNARQNAPRPTLGEIWTVSRDRLKGLFIKRTSANGTTGQTPGTQIRPIPVLVAALLIVGIVVLVTRRRLRQKHSLQ